LLFWTAGYLRSPTTSMHGYQESPASQFSRLVNGSPLSCKMLPTRSFLAAGSMQGTSFAMGRPRLVIMTGVRVVATSSRF
jgi:hypothetical protein